MLMFQYSICIMGPEAGGMMKKGLSERMRQ